MRATFDHSDVEAANITTFWFKPEKTLDYTAGQFIELTINHRHPDDRGEKRWFTLSSSPSQELVSITTKLSQSGSTFKQALRKLLAGDNLQMSEAMGDFVLPKFINQPLIFVAGGIGITPFHSIFEWLTEHHENRNIQFFYAVNNEDEIIFQATTQQAGVHTTIVVNQPSDSWGGERGRLSAELILGLAETTADSLFYLSGPEPMVKQLEKDLRANGINHQQLVTDHFPGYSTI